MHIKTKKALASGALAISLGALTIGIAGISPVFATVPTPPEDPQGGGTTDVTTSVTTLDWCGWYMSGVASALVLDNEEGITEYDGDAIPLSAQNTGLSAHVGGSSLYDELPDNCSWYGPDNKQAVAVTLSTTTNSFTATNLMGTDAEMDFNLDSDNKLNISVEKDTACTGFTTTDLDAIFGEDNESEPVSSALSASVGTNDVCDWSITYETSIPAGMVPTYGGTLYSYTGPTITTTLEIIEAAPAP